VVGASRALLTPGSGNGPCLPSGPLRRVPRHPPSSRANARTGCWVYRAAGLPKSRKPADRHANGSTSLAEGVNQRLRASMTGPVRQQLDRYSISAAG